VTAAPQVIEEQVAPPRRELGIVRMCGVLVAAVATLVTALVELYLTPLRLGGVPIGVAVVFAAVANWALAWFAVHTTGRRRAAGVPWVLWTVLMLFAAGTRTTEGDYLIGGNDWVALIMILVGSLSFAVYAYRLIMRRRPL
jgi:hypothetical protein